MKPSFNANFLRASIALALVAMALFVSPARAQSTLYWAGGTTNITDGTTIPTNFTTLSGNWDLTTKNFATATNGATYQAWSNGSIFSGYFGGWSAAYTTEYSRITNTANVDVSGFSTVIDKGVGSGNKWATMGADSARTITLLSGTIIDVRGGEANIASDSSGINMGLWINQTGTNVTLAGSGGFTKTGNYAFRLSGSHDGLTGTVNILHNGRASLDNNAPGRVILSGSLAGITNFNISASGFAAGTATALGSTAGFNVSDTSDNQLNDAAVVNLAGVGIFQFTGANGSTETIGSLRLASAGILNLSEAGGTGILAITNGIIRANDRAQLSVQLTSAGTNGSVVNLGSNHGLGTDVLVPWITDGTMARFGMVDASNNLAWVTPTDVTGNVSSITDINTNYRIVGNATSFGANTNFASGAAANTLSLYRSNSSSPVTVRITDTLTVGAGGIAAANGTANLDVTIEGTNGTSLTTTSNVLYIATGVGNAGQQGTLNINAPITGNIDVVKGGYGNVKFGGTNQANTYTGTTYVNSGSLVIGKSSGVNAINGNVVVRSGGILDLDSANQIVDTATVTIENGSYFKTDASSETIANLAGGGMLVSAVTTTTNSFTVNSSVAPGDGGIGTMTLNLGTTGGTNSFFRMNTNAAFTMELTAASGLTGDRVDFFNYNAGEFLLVGSNNINLTLLGTKTPGTYTNTIFRFYSDNGTTLTNSAISSGLTIGTWSGSDFASIPTIAYNGTTIDLTYEVVPEPSTYAQLGLSGLALAAYRLRRRNRRS